MHNSFPQPTAKTFFDFSRHVAQKDLMPNSLFQPSTKGDADAKMHHGHPGEFDRIPQNGRDAPLSVVDDCFLAHSVDQLPTVRMLVMPEHCSGMA
jgi:hypothetical protein